MIFVNLTKKLDRHRQTLCPIHTTFDLSRPCTRKKFRRFGFVVPVEEISNVIWLGLIFLVPVVEISKVIRMGLAKPQPI